MNSDGIIFELGSPDEKYTWWIVFGEWRNKATFLCEIWDLMESEYGLQEAKTALEKILPDDVIHSKVKQEFFDDRKIYTFGDEGDPCTVLKIFK